MSGLACSMPPTAWHSGKVRARFQWVSPSGERDESDVVFHVDPGWRAVMCDGQAPGPHPPGYGPSSKCPKLNRRGKGGAKADCRLTQPTVTLITPRDTTCHASVSAATTHLHAEYPEARYVATQPDGTSVYALADGNRALLGRRGA